MCMKHWQSFLASNKYYVRFRVAKVRFSQILEYFMHCITLAKERKEGKRPGWGTLGISGWGCASGTLEPLTYTRASSAKFCYPILA